jgi:hypothetical protein
VGFLHLLVEALLYYLACMLVARKREDAPGLIRVLITVLLLAFVSGGIRTVIGDFWLANALVFVLNFFILWIGLGIGFFRTILAAIVVILLRMLLEAVFVSHNFPGLMT